MKYYISLDNRKYEIEVTKEKASILGVSNLSTQLKVEEGRNGETTSITDKGSKDMYYRNIKTIKAPMSGRILNIKVEKGQIVNKGQCILVLEIMKMENELISSYSGIIEDIYYKNGDSVVKNQNIMDIKILK